MSVIQAISYPVSALVQSQQHVPPRDSAGRGHVQAIGNAHTVIH